MRRAMTLLAALFLVAGCATPPRQTPAERLEFYRSNAGEPVSSIHVPRNLWGWRSLGGNSLTIWTRSDTGFLLELVGHCPDMAFATSIGLTRSAGRVWAGFDSIVIQRSSRPGGPTTCRIDTIRPLNSHFVKEAKRDLSEVDVVERDPVAPAEPQ